MGKSNSAQINFAPKLNSLRNKPTSKAKSHVISRHFDSGSVMNLQMSQKKSTEYEVPASRAEFSEVLDEFSKGSAFEIDLADDAAIESFEKPGKLLNRPPQEPERISNLAEPEKDAKKESPNQNITENNGIKKDGISNENELKRNDELKKNGDSKKNDDNEKDDFISDLEAILKGQKKFDPDKKEFVETNSTKEKPVQKDSDGNPFKDSEHAIFDKIKENMAYANAYDLGEIQVQKMFKEFDKKFEEQEKSNDKKTSKNPHITDNYKATAMDFIHDMDKIIKPDAKQDAISSAKDTIPLDPGIGGQSIGIEALEPGDIIISTTNQIISKAIKIATDSEISHSAVYVGDGNVIEAVSDGVLLRSLNTALSDASLAVAYRHIHITPEKSQRMLNYLTAMKDQKRKYDFWGIVKIAPHQVMNTYIKKLPESVQEKLKNNIGSIKLGTDPNNEFYCSELVFDALKDAGLSISNVEATFKSPEDIVKLNHNGTLQYIGHLKS